MLAVFINLYCFPESAVLLRIPLVMLLVAAVTMAIVAALTVSTMVSTVAAVVWRNRCGSG